MNAHLIPILITVLILSVSPLMAREIRQERFSLLSEIVQVTDRETFVLTSTPNHHQPACKDRTGEVTDGCELPVVHFQLGSAELLKTEQDAMLAVLAHCAIAPGTGITVTGHTCSLGTEERNRILSRERAEQVAALLRSHGYTVSEVTAMGSLQPIPGTELASNRRVELVFIQP
ncbi:MAG: OmpA family protein [Desulfobulbus sp.]|uniref:OmpA family protein n=1 Tax=Desulfobulbus sp. TaxID=895 RepID=UPI00283C01C0|nr:OmpA family protein [Desulfobulbus sp.]MDR2548937.1 OmpA family protein [Desulfobulbus sp.]